MNTSLRTKIGAGHTGKILLSVALLTQFSCSADGGNDCAELTSVDGEHVQIGPGCVRVGIVEIPEDSTLEIMPGTTIFFERHGRLNFGWGGEGTIIARGTAQERILFTSAASDPLPGDWGCIGLSTEESVLEYADVEYGGYCDSAAVQVSRAESISNVTVRHSSGHGISVISPALGSFSNNTFGDNAEASVQTIRGGILALDGDNVFEDADDVIEADQLHLDDGESGTWHAQSVPYYVPEDGAFFPTSNVTIETGTTIQLSSSSEIYVSGILNADGVVFTTRDTPEDGAYSEYWDCLDLLGAEGSITNSVLEYAGACDSSGFAAVVANSKFEIRGNTFQHLENHAIVGGPTCEPSWCDNTFIDIGTPDDPIAGCDETTECL